MALARTKVHWGIPSWVPKYEDRRGHLNHASVALMLAHKAYVSAVSHRGPAMVSLLHQVASEDFNRRASMTGTRPVALDLKGPQDRLNRLKRELTQGLAAQSAGRKYIEKALRDAAFERTGSFDEQIIAETILHQANQEWFERMVESGVQDFLAAHEKRLRRFVCRECWNAPACRILDLSTPLDGYSKFLYRPLLAGQFNKNSSVEVSPSRMYLRRTRLCPYG